MHRYTHVLHWQFRAQHHLGCRYSYASHEKDLAFANAVQAEVDCFRSISAWRLVSAPFAHTKGFFNKTSVCFSSGIRLLFLQDMDVRNLTCEASILPIPPISSPGLQNIGSYTGTAIWSTVEVNVAVMSACLPTIRPLLRRTIPKLLSIGSFSFGSQKKSGGLVPCEDTYALRSTESRIPQLLPGPSQGHVTIPKSAEVQYVNIIQREIV